MATVRPQKPAASAKYDAFVAEQLDRARQRIRLLDVSSGLLLLLAVTLVYTLVVGLLDRRLDLEPSVRQVAFACYAAVAVVLLAVGVIRPLFRRVNPYYAARAVEAVVPGAKNSVVNWLDLHDEALPPAIRASLSQRAAKDLGRADLEQAISGRRAVWLTAVTALLALVLFGVFVTSGGGFGTLLARAFAPFGGGATARRTELTLVRPANGDAVIGVGQSFNVAVRVTGRVPDSDKPDALKLLFRSRASEPYEEQLLEPEGDNVWAAVVPPSRTFNGFWYKVTGGDAQTPEYHVTVRSSPLIERFDVTYHYRPYTGWPDDRTRDANLTALRGTEAELVVHTNRPVKEGRLEVETRAGKRPVPAELIADDPQAMRARLVMDEDGQYRVWFTTTDSDSNLAAVPYTIKVLADLPPKAELTEPGADVTLPANGTLRLKGSVSDDIGVKEVTLRLRLADGAALQPKPYRPGKSLRLGERGYPKVVDYQDFVALDQLKDGEGRPFAVSKGMVLEYWLEAADACDYPAQNRAESKHFKVTIGDPAADKQQQQKERDKAAEEQKKHDQQQDQKLKEEEQKRKEQADAKAAEQNGAKGDENPQEGGKPDKPQEGGDPSLKETAAQVGQAIDKEEREKQRQQEKAGAKGPEDGKGEAKGDNPDAQQGDRGGAKPEGQNDGGQQGSGKDEGAKQGGQQPDTGGGKPEGAPHQDAAAGDGKGKGQGEQPGSASAKPDGPPKPDKGDNKGGGKGDASQNAAAPKQHGDGPNGDQGEAMTKGAGRQEPGAPNDPAAAKGEQSLTKGAPKPGGSGGEPKADGKGEGRPHGGAAKAESKPGGPEKADGRGVAKDDPKQRNLSSELEKKEQNVRKGTEKQSAAAEKWLQELARNASDKDVRDLAKKILDDARKDRASSPALPKGPPPDDPRDGPPCECKGGGQGQGAGAAKSGGKDGGGKREGIVQVPQGGGRGSGAGRPPDGTSIAQGQRTKLQGLRADEAEPTPGDPAHRRRAGVLQLEDFTKIDKDILKDLKITPEQWEAFKHAYADKLRRDEAEQLPGSQNDRGVGSRSDEYKAEKKAGGDRTGFGQVPPEFRELFREYTRRQAEKK